MDREQLPSVVENSKENKKSIGQNLKETFIKEDIKDVFKYVWKEVTAPRISKSVYDTATSILARTLGIEKPQTPAGPSLPASRIGYHKAFDEKRQEAVPLKAQRNYSLTEVWYQSEGDANDVLQAMREQLERSRCVTVADYLDLSGRPKNISFTDSEWGWTDLGGTRILETGDAEYPYRLDLPKVRPLD